MSAKWYLPEIERATGRSKLGSSMTRASPRRDGIRSGSVVNIAAKLGKQDNCQIAVTLSIANHHARLGRRPIASICRRSGRRTVHVGAKLVYPSEITFSKPSRRSRLSNYAGPVWPAYRGVVLMDAGYGA